MEKFYKLNAQCSCNLQRKLLSKNFHDEKNDAYQVKRCQYKYFPLFQAKNCNICDKFYKKSKHFQN